MFLTHLWGTAAGRPASVRSDSVGPGALRQAVRPCGPPRGQGGRVLKTAPTLSRHGPISPP